MYELAKWIDKSFKEISETELYKKYFGDDKPVVIEETDDFSVENLDKGIDIVFTEGLFVSAIHLFSGDFMGVKPFKEELPAQLLFSYNRKKVDQLLEQPDATGGDFDDPVFGYIRPWSKYFLNTFSLHLKYSKDESQIDLVTLGSLKFEQDALPE